MVENTENITINLPPDPMQSTVQKIANATSLVFTMKNRTGENITISYNYTSPYIMEKNCSITAVLFQPNVEELSLWTLESAATYVHPKNSTCFLIQTSICQEKNDQLSQEEKSDEEAYGIVAKSIIDNAKPEFLKAIKDGRVRMTIIDHEKYLLKSCNNFKSPNNAWNKYDYWGSSEFIEQDSDYIFMLQRDGVICHPLQVDQWKEFAFVGAPWPPSKGPYPFQMASSMPKVWLNLHKGNVDNLPFPPFPTEDEIFTQDEFCPVGNGGMSIRSRDWMRKAIRYCPTTSSGFSEEEIESSPCSKLEGYNEDQLFGTILRGIGAPLPTGYEASLFGTELRTPNSMFEHYNLSSELQEQIVQKRWWTPENEKDVVELYREMKEAANDPIISLTMHKPWDLYPGYWNTPHMQKYCPFLQHILPEKEK